ncbi:EAL domain-containing protein [Hydrogenimonas urashimensis]|uniref:EAL domain-containing protein n=1 Tax=Hydrogenimonas urashimensis TaxID=2740515 RepID=UPI001F2CCCAE|nr:GGDEF domain-containing protein [Hydrogenimonas urashimensis]
MLFSEKQERARRFRLALRMGIPILLLISVLVFYFFRQSRLQIERLDIAVFVAVLFISVYFLFFLINLGQSETLVDRMTGAFNRDSLMDALKKAMKHEKEYSILLLRLDNLPFISDHYGIERGDRLLKVFVSVLNEFFRRHDLKEPLIGRYHGGDFIIGLPLEAQESLNLIEDFVSTYREISNLAVEFKYAAVQKESASDLNALITYLYDTISQQKGSSEKKEPQEKRLDIDLLEREIVEAVHDGALLLHYIPTLNSRKNEIDLFEVGVRLKTKNNGILPPKKFIPVVNRMGLEKAFDAALFESICKDAVRVRSDIQFSFNISPFSLRNESFVETIKTVASREGVEYERIIIELFENRAFKDITRYRMILEELRELGIKFALDNFGAPNASFEYIKKLPVDMVQFDRDFTISYNNPKISSLLKGYIQACRSMGIKTLIKWVDTEEALERFRQLGIDYIQGFIVSNRPLGSEQLIKKYGAKR